jgi:GNAT superfamily N-acetyltransferase
MDSWRTSRYAGVVRNNDYYTVTRSVIEDLLARGAVVLVADAGPSLLGFACGEEKDGVTVMHYIYVKDPFHGFGVEEKLLEALPGRKPGFFTFFLHRLGKLKAWRHAPEIARRKSL